MRVSVSNKQQYGIHRGGHFFPAGETVELDVSTPKRLAEIKACVYLKVAMIEEPVDESPTFVDAPAATADELQDADLSVVEALQSMTVAQLRERADELGIEVGAKARKADLIVAITAALEALDIDTEIAVEAGDLPPFVDWELEGLIQLAAEWGLGLPEDVDYETAMVLVQSEYERRQLLDAESIESDEAA